MNDEPVEASPPSSFYILRKFARRYRAALKVIVFVSLLLAFGLTSASGVFWLLKNEADHQRDLAIAALSKLQYEEHLAAQREQEAAAARDDTEAVNRFMRALLGPSSDHPLKYPTAYSPRDITTTATLAKADLASQPVVLAGVLRAIALADATVDVNNAEDEALLLEAIGYAEQAPGYPAETIVNMKEEYLDLASRVPGPNSRPRLFRLSCELLDLRRKQAGPNSFATIRAEWYVGSRMDWNSQEGVTLLRDVFDRLRTNQFQRLSENVVIHKIATPARLILDAGTSLTTRLFRQKNTADAEATINQFLEHFNREEDRGFRSDFLRGVADGCNETTRKRKYLGDAIAGLKPGDDPSLMIDYVQVLQLTNDTARAEEYVSAELRALEDRPQPPPGNVEWIAQLKLALAQVLQAQGKISEAEAQYKDIYTTWDNSQDPTDEALLEGAVSFGEILLRRNQTADAGRAFTNLYTRLTKLTTNAGTWPTINFEGFERRAVASLILISNLNGDSAQAEEWQQRLGRLNATSQPATQPHLRHEPPPSNIPIALNAISATDETALTGHMGSRVVIQGQVFDTVFTRDHTGLNVEFYGADDSLLMLWIPADSLASVNRAFLGDASLALSGQTVLVTGTLKPYGGRDARWHNRLQIQIDSPQQMRILSSPRATTRS